MLLKLFCAIVGVAGSPFEVKIDDAESVSALKDKIKGKNLTTIKGDAKDLKLFLAKDNSESSGEKDATEGNKWLSDESEAALKLVEGTTHGDIKALTDGEPMMATKTLAHWLFQRNKMETPSTDQIHVLVKISGDEVSGSTAAMVPLNEKDIAIINTFTNGAQEELEYYKQQGRHIRKKCAKYCRKILDRIDEIYFEYKDVKEKTFPFMCVEGSSGMGKSQLAFALGRRRPWFYWLSTLGGGDSQLLYANFAGVSRAFREVVDLDDFSTPKLDVVLNSESTLYFQKDMWTYGFIRALLNRCSLKESEKRSAEMMSFGDIEALHVEKCNVVAVWETIAGMKKEKKLLPFFILDEMTPNSDPNGMKLAAFQRNVFRTCGLVVLVMGTDSKISDLVEQSGHSFTRDHTWMTIVPRFPRYQIMLRTRDSQHAWSKLNKKWPILQQIATHSRGRFARNFIDKVIEYVAAKGVDGLDLPHLLDSAFDHVAREAIDVKRIMDKHKGKEAQLMAISYTNAESIVPNPPAGASRGESKSPAKRKASGSGATTSSKRRKVGAVGMHLHFANLVDKDLTTLTLRDGELKNGEKAWEPFCRFPAVKEDLLLYLAILGGKDSGYYNKKQNVTFSVKRIFLDYLNGKGYSIDENLNAPSNDYKTFENMVSHAVFCSSRRNGVKGIPFTEFFDCLIGEFKDNYWTKMKIDTKDILQEFAANVASLQDTVVPFLGPPNAKWPQYILDTSSFGCNFGHLVRAVNQDRCDVYVQTADSDPGAALFLCECKHWRDSIGMDAMDSIIAGLKSAWQENWSVVLLFCTALASSFRSSWKHADIGCVKVNCGDGIAKWVSPHSRPRKSNRPVRRCTVTRPERKKLVIVVETGHLESEGFEQAEDLLLSDSEGSASEDSQDSDWGDSQDSASEDLDESKLAH